MTAQSARHDEMMFAYIDSELSPQQAVEFEQLLERDPLVRSRLDMLSTINIAIQKIPETTQARTIPLQTLGNSGTLSKRRLLSYAAMLIICAGAYFMLNPPTPTPTFDAYIAYTRITEEFEPDVVCDTPEKFVTYTQETFGSPVSADFTSPIQLVGWKYHGKAVRSKSTNKFKRTRILMAQTPEGTRILVAFVPKGLPIPRLEAESGMNIFKRTVQSVRVYEITPLDSPSVLDLLE